MKLLDPQFTGTFSSPNPKGKVYGATRVSVRGKGLNIGKLMKAYAASLAESDPMRAQAEARVRR